jgi:hypothetical protein
MFSSVQNSVDAVQAFLTWRRVQGRENALEEDLIAWRDHLTTVARLAQLDAVESILADEFEAAGPGLAEKLRGVLS